MHINKKDVLDTVINPIITITLCFVLLIVLWSHQPFDLVNHFYSSVIYIAIVMFMFYGSDHTTLYSLIMLGVMISLLALSLMIVYYVGEYILYLTIMVFSTDRTL